MNKVLTIGVLITLILGTLGLKKTDAAISVQSTNSKSASSIESNIASPQNPLPKMYEFVDLVNKQTNNVLFYFSKEKNKHAVQYIGPYGISTIYFKYPLEKELNEYNHFIKGLKSKKQDMKSIEEHVSFVYNEFKKKVTKYGPLEERGNIDPWNVFHPAKTLSNNYPIICTDIALGFLDVLSKTFDKEIKENKLEIYYMTGKPEGAENGHAWIGIKIRNRLIQLDPTLYNKPFDIVR